MVLERDGVKGDGMRWCGVVLEWYGVGAVWCWSEMFQTWMVSTEMLWKRIVWNGMVLEQYGVGAVRCPSRMV